MRKTEEYQFIVLYKKSRNKDGKQELIPLATYGLDEEGPYKVYLVDDNGEPEGFRIEPKENLRLYNKILKLAGKNFRLVLKEGQLEKKLCKPRNPLNPEKEDIDFGATENFINGF